MCQHKEKAPYSQGTSWKWGKREDKKVKKIMPFKGCSFIPDQGTKIPQASEQLSPWATTRESMCPQQKIPCDATKTPCATTETQHSQINKEILKKNQNGFVLDYEESRIK